MMCAYNNTRETLWQMPHGPSSDAQSSETTPPPAQFIPLFNLVHLQLQMQFGYPPIMRRHQFLEFTLTLLCVLCSVSNSFVLPQTASLSTSSILSANSSLSGPVHCQISAIGPLVDLDICRPTFAQLLNALDANDPMLYKRERYSPIYFSNAPCAISLDSNNRGADRIAISKRQIVAEVGRILALCQQYMEGGWTWVDGYVGWIVIVDAIGRGRKSHA